VAALITPAQAREHIESDLIDSAMQRLIDDADALIVERFGPHTGQTTDTIFRDMQTDDLLFLKRPLTGSPVSVTEWINDFSSIVLDPTDYRILYGGRALQRLINGVTGRSTWGARVVVVFNPLDELAKRTRVEIDLVRLAAQYNGLSREQVGDYMSISKDEYQGERDKILDGLAPAIAFA